MILVRRETTPEDIHGMKVAEGILTELGGMTSHAAVVARGMGVCAITGCSDLSIDYAAGTATSDSGTVIKRGDVITLDGSTGEVMLGDIPKVEASASDDFQTTALLGRQIPPPESPRQRGNPGRRRQGARAGCRGYWPVPHRAHVLRRRSHRCNARHGTFRNHRRAQKHLAKLHEFQEEDMFNLFREMAGLPVTIRLLDPPLHEFLPHVGDRPRPAWRSTAKPVEQIKAISRTPERSKPHARASAVAASP